MKETVVDDKALEDAGLCVLIYGKVGVGKTESLLTLRDPLLIISTEPKDIKRTIKQALKRRGEKNRKITIWEFEKFDEYMQSLDALVEKYENGGRPFRSIGFDTLSFAQSKFKLDLEDDRFDLRLEQERRRDSLIDRFRMERGDWGGLGSMMVRLTALLNRISKYGVIVVATAGLMEYPSWNKLLEAAPAFQGIDYPRVMAGFFDLVGLVEPNPKNPDYPYPPIVRFVSDGSFVARNCSDALGKKGRGVLDFEKILKVMES